jgi:sugar lactone lactonase YvrE
VEIRPRPAMRPIAVALGTREKVEQHPKSRWHAPTLFGDIVPAMRRASVLPLIAALLALGAPPAGARDRFDVKVLARVPAPGYPALSLVAPNRTIYVGTFTNVQGDDTGPSKVFAFAPDGRLDREFTIEGQTPGTAHGVQVAAIDAKGRLYLLDQHPARVLILDPATGKQTTYGTFKDVGPCLPGAATGDCSATTTDNEPEPDYAAWGTDGSLYVTDYTQGLIWRVPPGGGEARIWLTDPQLDGAEFGPAGIVLMPDHKTLMISTSAGGVATAGDPTTGKLYTVPIKDDGKPGSLTKLYESGPREGPDGFAIAASGNIYLALVGPGANQVVQIDPKGKELARVPGSPAANAQMEVPFDSPSSVQFDGERLIVTNDSYFSGDASHMVLFDVFASEPGEPVFVPGVTQPSPEVVKSKKRHSLSVTPRVVRSGQRRRFRFSARVADAAGKRPFARGVVSFAGRRVRLDARGVGTMRIRLVTRGKRTARLIRPGGSRRVVAKAIVRVR